MTPAAPSRGARRALRLRDDAGITVTELLVGMAIAGLVGAMTLGLFLSLNTAAGATTERAVATAEARVAFDAWNGLLAVRESPLRDEAVRASVEMLGPDEIVFFSSIDNRSAAGGAAPTAPTRIRIATDGRVLVEERYAPIDDSAASPEYAAAPTVRRVLSTDASLSVRAFAADGGAIATSAELDNSQRAQIDRIELAVTIIDARGASHTYGAAS